MNVQNYLKEFGWIGLEKLSIKRKHYENLGINVLNYCQIKIPAKWSGFTLCSTIPSRRGCRVLPK